MCEPEGQHLITFVGRRRKIFSPLSIRHRIPLAISNSIDTVLEQNVNFKDTSSNVLVPPDIEGFGSQKQHNVVGTNGDKNLVTCPIHWLVVVAVDL